MWRHVILALAISAWLCGITAGYIPMASTHGCAPPIPPPVSGSPAPAPARAGVILLNEVLLTPVSTWNCAESGTSFQTYDSWVELYNPQPQPFNLYKAHASLDSGPNTNPYYLRFGAAIAAHGFLVVFPYHDTYFAATHTPLLRLVIPNVVIDQVTIPTLLGDQSYARATNGGATWQVTNTPTIDASNNPIPQTGPPSTPSKHHRAKGRGRGHTTTGSSSSTAQVNGVQPTGNTLHLPETATPTPGAPPVTAPIRTAATSTADTPRAIGLGALGVGLVLSLLWCWRLFMRKGA